MPNPEGGAPSGASWLRAAGGIAAGALLIALVVVAVTWPVFSRPSSAIYVGRTVADTPWMRLLAGAPGERVPGSSPDPDLWARLGAADTLRGLWTLAWWSHAAFHPAASFYDGNTLFPVPHALTYADLQLGVAPWFAPTYWLTGNPVFAYQLALLLSATSCGVLFLVLVYRWTGSAGGALAAGIAGAIAPFRAQQLQLLYLFAIQYLPAGMLAIDLVLGGRRRALAAAVLGIAIVLQASCSAYATYTAFLLLPAYAAGALLEERPLGATRCVAWLVAAFVIAAGVVVLLYRPFFAHVETGVVPSAGDAAIEHAGPLLWLWLLPGANLGLHFLAGVGAPMLLLAGFGVLHRASRRRWTALGVTAVGTVLALGPALRVGSRWLRPLPWAWVAAIVPGFGAQRHAVVTATIVGVGLVCLVGLGVAVLLQRGRRHRGWAALAVVLVGWAAWSNRAPVGRPPVLPVATGDRVPPVYQWLADNGGGGPLLELPAQLVANAVYAYFSTYHWLPTFNGTFSAPPPGYLALVDRAADALDPARGPAFVREVPVTWILVHGALLPPADAARMAAPPPHLEEAARFGDDVVYRVRRP